MYVAILWHSHDSIPELSELNSFQWFSEIFGQHIVCVSVLRRHLSGIHSILDKEIVHVDMLHLLRAQCHASLHHHYYTHVILI